LIVEVYQVGEAKVLMYGPESPDDRFFRHEYHTILDPDFENRLTVLVALGSTAVGNAVLPAVPRAGNVERSVVEPLYEPLTKITALVQAGVFECGNGAAIIEKCNRTSVGFYRPVAAGRQFRKRKYGNEFHGPLRKQSLT
jgi:hypothetical protein